MVVQYMPQQRRKRCERHQVGFAIGRNYVPWRRPIGRTSRPEPQANGLHLTRSNYSEKQPRPICRSPRERRPNEQTKDAMCTAVPEAQFRGCSQALLYNEERPHAPWGDRPKDADYVAQSRWRHQPAIVKKPESSSLRRSNVGSHSKLEQTLFMNEGKLGSRAL